MRGAAAARRLSGQSERLICIAAVDVKRVSARLTTVHELDSCGFQSTLKRRGGHNRVHVESRAGSQTL